jgi:molybdopterin-guanine dinucleotide biosynthesis protein A
MPSAAILAGGQARRFAGRDKGRLDVGGVSIFDRQLGELSAVADDIMVVGKQDAARRGETAVRVVPDRVSGCGPLGGLDAALAAAAHDEIIVVACDMPFVTGRLFEYLLSLAAGSDAVVPRTKRGYHPLCAVYTRGCQAAVARCLADRRLAMMDLLRAIRVRDVHEHELERFGKSDWLLANVNSRSELDELNALTGHPA